jgi:hypothetical protein
MALKAIVARACPVFEYLNVCNLPRIGCAGDNIVTFTAPYAIVITVSEDRFEIIFRLGCSIIRRQLMAYAALSELGLSRVAAIASGVRLKANRYRFTGS